LDEYPELGESVASVHSTALAHARIADELGFSALWIAEHHFQRLGTAANPAVVLSAIAQHTERIRLGPAVCVLPVRNPIQVAEDYALVDILSNGRLNMGVGTGSQAMEFEGLGADFEGREKIFTENLSTLKRRWAAASSGERGAHSLNVAPLQSPAPPVYVTSNREAGAYEIGLQGHSLLTLVSPVVESLRDVEARLRGHRRGLDAGGHAAADAEAVVVVFAHVAESLEAARGVAGPALGRLLEALAGAAPPDPAAVFDMMVERGTAVFGPTSCVEKQLGRFGEIGVDHITFISRFGGTNAAASEQNLRSLAPAA
jgi:alkanesulfonate monooxygenase SsuD/methylene tetrahydromethanopterin reductase-like flavin-dependent oxidoreductase (luciferase family)